MTRRGLPSISTTVPGGATMVRFALPEVDLGDGFRFADLRDLSDLEPDFDLVAGLAGLALDFFFSVLAGLRASRPAGFCAKSYWEKARTEKTEETKRIKDRTWKIEDRR